MFFTTLNSRLGLDFEFHSDFLPTHCGSMRIVNVINVYIVPFLPDINAGLWSWSNIEVSFSSPSHFFFFYTSPKIYLVGLYFEVKQANDYWICLKKMHCSSKRFQFLSPSIR